MKKLLILGLALFIFGCSAQEEPSDEEQIIEEIVEIKETSEEVKAAIFFTIVDKLRIRSAPNLTSEVLGRLDKNTKLIYLKEKSRHQDSVEIDRVLMTDYWYKVKVAYRNTKGWVFGGYLTRRTKLKEFYSLKELEKAYPNLANDCEMISKYTYPRPYIVEKVLSKNSSIGSIITDDEKMPFQEMLEEAFEKTNLLKDAVLFPVYETEDGEISILDSNFFLSEEAKKKRPSYFREIILKDFLGEGERERFVKIEEELEANEYWINVLTNKRNVKARLKNYEEYRNTCLEYSNVKLEGINLEEGEFPLLGSFDDIEIDYDIPENRIKQFNGFKLKMSSCLIDCGNNTIDMKIIGHFRNTDLYIAGNSRKEMGEIDTQDRFIFYMTDKIAIALQHKAIDYFGCVCL